MHSPHLLTIDSSVIFRGLLAAGRGGQPIQSLETVDT